MAICMLLTLMSNTCLCAKAHHFPKSIHKIWVGMTQQEAISSHYISIPTRHMSTYNADTATKSRSTSRSMHLVVALAAPLSRSTFQYKGPEVSCDNTLNIALDASVLASNDVKASHCDLAAELGVFVLSASFTLQTPAASLSTSSQCLPCIYTFTMMRNGRHIFTHRA